MIENSSNVFVKPQLLLSSLSKENNKGNKIEKRNRENTNNNNRRSIKFINVISNDSLSYKKNICFLIDSKKHESFCVPSDIEKYYKSTLNNNINQLQEINEKKINKLFKGIPTVTPKFDYTNKNINNTTKSDTTNEFLFEYYFYSYLYPSEADEGLIPFLEHFDKHQKSIYINDNDDAQLANDNMTEYGGDRRLKSVENKCHVKIKIGHMGEKLIKGLPRRKITISAKKPEHVATALSCLEDTIPEIFENALFTKPLECKTQKWPNNKGVLVRHLRKSMHFHRRALNCPLMSSIWFKSIDPRRIFPSSNIAPKGQQKKPVNANRSNECDTVIYPTNSDDFNEITEQTTKFVSSSIAKQYENDENGEISGENNNNNEIEENKSQEIVFEKEDLLKYLKFPYSKESHDLFRYNQLGEPVNHKFKEYLNLCKCFVENIKCKVDKFGTTYNIVKIRYQNPSQLVKLFLLLNYKIKY